MERTIEETIARPVSEYLLSRLQDEDAGFIVSGVGDQLSVKKKGSKVQLPPTVVSGT